MSDRLVSDLRFHIGGAEYHFLPAAAKPEDTPYLLVLFVALTASARIGPFDAQGYVDERGLWHCFRAVE